jgi:hypothetical protein
VSNKQDRVTREWDGLAGHEWDGLAGQEWGDLVFRDWFMDTARGCYRLTSNPNLSQRILGLFSSFVEKERMAVAARAWAVHFVGVLVGSSHTVAAWTIPTTTLSRGRGGACVVGVATRFTQWGIRAMTVESTTEPSWSAQLMSFLDKLEQQGSGTFATCKEMDVPALFPQISVEGLGLLGFPFMVTRIDALKALSTPTRSEPQSVVDKLDCKSWQIDATAVTFENSTAWDTMVHDLASQAMKDLGIEDQDIEVKFSKLVLCEGGGHCVSHVGTEDEAVFATMVIQLPSLFTGGNLTLSNGGESKTFELSQDCTKQFKCLAFYSDCELDPNPIASGIHLSLVFHVQSERTLETAKPSHLSNLVTTSKLQSFASSWKAEKHPLKLLGYPLQFEVNPFQTFEYYQSKHNLFENLDDHDAIVFDALKNAKCPNDKPLFHVELVLLERWRDFRYKDDGESVVVQHYDKDGNEVRCKGDYFAHSDGWWLDEHDYTRLNPDVEVLDMGSIDKAYKAIGKDMPYYDMFYKWGDCPHVTRSSETPGVDFSVWYAAGVIIALADR